MRNLRNVIFFALDANYKINFQSELIDFLHLINWFYKKSNLKKSARSRATFYS